MGFGQFAYLASSFTLCSVLLQRCVDLYSLHAKVVQDILLWHMTLNPNLNIVGACGAVICPFSIIIDFYSLSVPYNLFLVVEEVLRPLTYHKYIYLSINSRVLIMQNYYYYNNGILIIILLLLMLITDV